MKCSCEINELHAENTLYITLKFVLHTKGMGEVWVGTCPQTLGALSSVRCYIRCPPFSREISSDNKMSLFSSGSPLSTGFRSCGFNHRGKSSQRYSECTSQADFKLNERKRFKFQCSCPLKLVSPRSQHVILYLSLNWLQKLKGVSPVSCWVSSVC